jgi:hypothetical protein
MSGRKILTEHQTESLVRGIPDYKMMISVTNEK